MIRSLLALFVVLTTILAAWVWTAEYDKNPDPDALFTIEASRVKRDRGNRWLDIHLKRVGEKPHILSKPVRLVSGNGTEFPNPDITFAGNPETGFTEIWLKFWLEDTDLEDTLAIHLNDGVLRVKTNQGAPELENGKEKVFKSADWEKSWLGF